MIQNHDLFDTGAGMNLFQALCTENWEDLFQPQSVNSALLAKV